MATVRALSERLEGRYEVHRKLQGGMGIVYIVFDPRDFETRALKTFRDELFNSRSDAFLRFQQEVCAWMQLGPHENIVRAYELEVINCKPHLLLEYVSGGDLGQWIGSARLMEDIPGVLDLGIQFCNGMIYAYSQGIKVHRDIKPRNCLLTTEGILKVTDFGLAKVLDHSKPFEPIGRTNYLNSLGVHGSRTGRAVGTCTHMAPEQFDDAKRVDVRADIYSFGVMLFQMITGRLPFQGRSFNELRNEHWHAPPPSLPTACSLPKRYRSKLDAVIKTCLHKNPGRRFNDFLQVRNILVELYAGVMKAKRLHGPHAAPQFIPKSKESLIAAGRDTISEKEGLLRAASTMHKLARFEEALVCYGKALEITQSEIPSSELSRDSAKILVGMARAALGCLLFPKAFECCDLVLDNLPGNTLLREEALFIKALGHSGSDQNRLANDLCNIILKTNQCHVGAWYCKAGALLALRHWDRYRLALENCLKLQAVGPGWVIRGIRGRLSKGWWRPGWWWEEATGLDLDYYEIVVSSRGFGRTQGRTKKPRSASG